MMASKTQKGSGQSQKKPAWRSGVPSTNANGLPSPPISSPAFHKSVIPDGLNEASKQLMHDRLTFLVVSLIGCKVVATVKGGTRIEGILASAVTETDLGLVLRLAQDLTRPDANLAKTLVIYGKDIQEIVASNVDLEDMVEEGSTKQSSFKTDTDISGGYDPSRGERQLQRWSTSLPNEPFDEEDGTLESIVGTNNRSWDQFAVNQELFGTTSNYDEDLYTTKLDRSAPDFKLREKKADQMAAEILGTTASNVHIAEERGQSLAEDEESRYGSVVRGPNAYIPPGARKTVSPQSNIEPAKDPSQIHLPAVVVQPTSPVPSSSTFSSLPQTNSQASQTPMSISVSQPIVIVEQTSRQSGERERIPLPLSNRIPAPGLSSTEETVKKEPRGVLDAIAGFVEKEKVKANEKKAALLKKEKESKLADLREFSEKFKLKTPVPADLAPIIKKSPTNTSDSKPDEPKATPIPAATSSALGISKTTQEKSVLKKSTFVIQAIPPFNPKNREVKAIKTSVTPAATVLAPSQSETPAILRHKESAPKVNGNGPAVDPQPPFRPNPNASTFTPVVNGHSTSTSSSPSHKVQDLSSNPFFGSRSISKKNSSTIYVKEDFAPKLSPVEANTTGFMWYFGYPGKPYRYTYSMQDPDEHLHHLTPQPQAQQVTVQAPAVIPGQPPQIMTPYGAPPPQYPVYAPQFRYQAQPQHPQAVVPHPAIIQQQPPISYPTHFVQMPFPQQQPPPQQPTPVYNPHMPTMPPPQVMAAPPMHPRHPTMPQTYPYPPNTVAVPVSNFAPPPPEHYQA